MNARILLAISIYLSASFLQASYAQSLQDLKASSSHFESPQIGGSILFPKDHGSHINFRTEWWYLTTNLHGSDGENYGSQWTLFRHSDEPYSKNGWEDPSIWMGHAAVTSAHAHYYTQTIGRGGVGQAGVEIKPFHAYIDDWSFTAQDQEFLTAIATATGQDFTYRLNLIRSGPFVLQGEAGYSLKSENGQASYYYSQPYFKIDGELIIQGRAIKVSGLGWMDREWSSQILSPDQKGWDWFSLHLKDGTKLMLFRLRGLRDYISGNWISSDGQTSLLKNDDITLQPLDETNYAGHKAPTRWRIGVRSHNFEILTNPLNPNSWMLTTIPYWEGPIRFTGTQEGVGYLEMTGY